MDSDWLLSAGLKRRTRTPTKLYYWFLLLLLLVPVVVVATVPHWCIFAPNSLLHRQNNTQKHHRIITGEHSNTQLQCLNPAPCLSIPDNIDLENDPDWNYRSCDLAEMDRNDSEYYMIAAQANKYMVALPGRFLQISKLCEVELEAHASEFYIVDDVVKRIHRVANIDSRRRLHAKKRIAAKIQHAVPQVFPREQGKGHPGDNVEILQTLSDNQRAALTVIGAKFFAWDEKCRELIEAIQAPDNTVTVGTNRCVPIEFVEELLEEDLEWMYDEFLGDTCF